MTHRNTAIRNAAREAGVKLWQIADELKITDGSFSRKLRYELPDEEQNRILQIIAELASKEATE